MTFEPERDHVCHKIDTLHLCAAIALATRPLALTALASRFRSVSVRLELVKSPTVTISYVRTAAHLRRSLPPSPPLGFGPLTSLKKTESRPWRLRTSVRT